MAGENLVSQNPGGSDFEVIEGYFHRFGNHEKFQIFGKKFFSFKTISDVIIIKILGDVLVIEAGFQFFDEPGVESLVPVEAGEFEAGVGFVPGCLFIDVLKDWVFKLVPMPGKEFVAEDGVMGKPDPAQCPIDLHRHGKIFFPITPLPALIVFNYRDTPRFY